LPSAGRRVGAAGRQRAGSLRGRDHGDCGPPRRGGRRALGHPSHHRSTGTAPPVRRTDQLRRRDDGRPGRGRGRARGVAVPVRAPRLLGPAAELITVGALELAADNTYDLPRVPAWRRGPMVVVGDAAHAPSPSSGQGASMSLEDAVVLAGSLRRAPSVAAGSATYEARRRTRVERIVRYGARSSSTKTSGPMAAVSATRSSPSSCVRSARTGRPGG
jgi:2-polyprenyl-6-methoxyphenol hydroxylase-like FAD-dependent oxidoreductase